MIKRKLIKQGLGGFTIYLPKKWIDHYKLRPGDEINILEVENNLLLSAKARHETKQITLNFTQEHIDKTLIRISLNDVYRLGYDKITVNYKTAEQRKRILKIVDEYLLGFEVTEEKRDKFVIENVTEPSEEKQETIVKRMFYLIKESFKTVNKHMAKNDFKRIDKMSQLTKKVDRYNNYCRRNISKKRFQNERVYFYWGLYIQLLLIQHSLFYFYRVMHDTKKIKIKTSIIKIFKQLQSNFDELTTAFFKKDCNEIGKINNRTNKYFYNHIQKQIIKSKGKDSLLLYYLGELGRVIYLSTSPMLGILFE